MATLNDTIFFIQLFSLLAISAAQFYYISSGGKAYSKKIVFLLFFGSLLMWFFGFTTALLEVDTLTYWAFMNLETGILGLNTFFFIVCLFLMIPQYITEAVKPYNPREQRG